ncbi:PhoD-like phosphatase [Halopseudomonas sabulinigri]|uniref:PhoD-like phosphatase n=1 Tax=Halopseudomonas sabulinigri TaxID=472181 RepID=A0A1H1UXX5_9GAMM|nr:alkaline phosphatase D family protein [Halopseudomonas sabulinigri]SDS77365.1 PhoD-like phosphatase [Halopseudomonas sabulinigri]
MHSTSDLPDLLVGPLVRRVAPEQLLLWLVASRPLELTATLRVADGEAQQLPLHDAQVVPIGRHAFVHLLSVRPASPLPQDSLIHYDLRWHGTAGETGLREAAPHLCHDGELPSLMIASHNRRLLHGSCRKPHFASEDALVRTDSWLAERRDDPARRPSWLLMTGDQVYVDDVSGPLLVASHALIKRLGLFDEALEGATVADSQALYQATETYYRREQLLPDVPANMAVRDRFFGGVRKPVFTSANAQNHLITLAEMLATYLLVWSPTPWTLIAPAPPGGLSDEERERYDAEQEQISAFVAGLPQVARLLAHQPTLMIFDDHDVTDDWNLTAAWERTAYGHPFSRQIIGNALLAYLLCQGWGNDPEAIEQPLERLATLLNNAAGSGQLEVAEQDRCINALLQFHGWEYQIPGTPTLVVLDTRTRRWRSERSPFRPSGLMGWEALTELQQRLIDQTAVVIVSPAPMFGVKLIEGVQKLFALAGKPLVVDAENWMAHRGAAKVLLNIFRHGRTPGNYVILSGDVHYSFVYDIAIRDRQQGPQLWQITSSGLKNAFPPRLLDWFDRLNRWLYSPASPLNWLTKRRRMRVTPRDPDRASAGERLWHGSGIGLVELNEQGRPTEIRELDARGFDIGFPPSSRD